MQCGPEKTHDFPRTVKSYPACLLLFFYDRFRGAREDRLHRKLKIGTGQPVQERNTMRLTRMLIFAAIAGLAFPAAAAPPTATVVQGAKDDAATGVVRA